MTVSIGDDVAFESVLAPISANGISGRLSVLNADFGFDDPVDVIVHTSVDDKTGEFAQEGVPTRNFVPFASGNTQVWKNDSW